MISRRNFLKALGASSALTSSGLWSPFRAHAQSMAPKRLIIVSHCHGWPYDAWKIRPAGKIDTETWTLNFSEMMQSEFSQILAPLYRHRNRMLALDGLSLVTAELDMDGNRHDTGWVHAWTGNWANFSSSDTRSRSSSLDQLIAPHIARTDRLPSIEISVDDASENGRPISYGANGVRLPIENTPQRVWERLFGPSAAPDPLTARRKSAIDFAYAEYAQLAPRLGAEQRMKLDAHYNLLSGLSQRIEGMSMLNCNDTPGPVMSQPDYDSRFDTFSDLVTAAFACDVTRVATLSLGEMPTANFGADDISDNVHKGLAHEIYNSPAKHQAMADYLTMHMTQLGRLVDKLSDMPDVDGRSVMDNTLIVSGSELANGWHGYQHYCPIILGGGWHFDTGRYLHWPHETPSRVLAPGGFTETSGLPHQHLLISVAQAMGMDTDHVGLKHVQSQDGHHLDLIGPLPNLI
ncbi:MAG: DUF1552 domain-containing protein [Myxococcota bacterium]|nr:DUF1552 domain-containing protein [Myxococcota bacterium]